MCENILTQQAGIPDHISGEKGCTLPVSENIPSGHAGNQGNLSGEQGCTLPVREQSEWTCWKSRTPIWWARLYIACVSTFSHNNLEINTTHLVRKGVHCLCLCENMCQGYLSSTELEQKWGIRLNHQVKYQVWTSPGRFLQAFHLAPAVLGQTSLIPYTCSSRHISFHQVLPSWIKYTKLTTARLNGWQN